MQVMQLDCFPEQAVADVERVHGRAGSQGFAEEDGAVEAAADEDGEGGWSGVHGDHCKNS